VLAPDVDAAQESGVEITAGSAPSHESSLPFEAEPSVEGDATGRNEMYEVNQIAIAESDADLQKVCGPLLQLRPTFDAARLVAQIKRQMQAGYRVAYLESDGEVLCVAGFVVGSKLAWGKHLYVDDLVTVEHRRSSGAGTAMIAWLKSHARNLGCEQLHLDSGVQRFAAHRFYLREGFDIASHHFSMKNVSRT
jgi:GNAT superfamily N-acetyltransferase